MNGQVKVWKRQDDKMNFVKMATINACKKETKADEILMMILLD